MSTESPAAAPGTHFHHEFVFCHPCGITIMILIVPTTFHTHCVRVSIQIRANIIIFFINSMYDIKQGAGLAQAV
jgi:hypothetical protein